MQDDEWSHGPQQERPSRVPAAGSDDSDDDQRVGRDEHDRDVDQDHPPGRRSERCRLALDEVDDKIVVRDQGPDPVEPVIQDFVHRASHRERHGNHQDERQPRPTNQEQPEHGADDGRTDLKPAIERGAPGQARADSRQNASCRPLPPAVCRVEHQAQARNEQRAAPVLGGESAVDRWREPEEERHRQRQPLQDLALDVTKRSDRELERYPHRE
jgi:hypothetical protein